MVIIQHPGGGPKQIALAHNLVTFVNHQFVHYLTDTMPGSSGSPVFNEAWQVIALHHSGGWLREPGGKEQLFRNEGIAIEPLLSGAQELLRGSRGVAMFARTWDPMGRRSRVTCRTNG